MHPCVPMGVLGAFGLVGGLCVLYLPETGNKPLEGTLHEQESSDSQQGSPKKNSNNYNHNHIDDGNV